MREGFDREMDSLLRRTARAPAVARGNGAGMSKPDTHLDADELAAFAEGALPEVARMSAVSHLADCGECRALAVNLTRAAGVEAKLEKHSVAASASPARESVPKRGWLASIFAPRTLRYVAPALAVCLVAAVSFIVLRSPGGLERATALRDGETTTGARPSAVTTQNNSQAPAEGLMTLDAPADANTATAKPDNGGPSPGDKNPTQAPAPETLKKEAGADAPDGSAPGSPAESKAVEVTTAPPPPPAKEDDSAGGAPAPREAAKAAPVAEIPASKSGDNMKAGPPPPAQTNDELAYNNESQQQRRAAQQRGIEPQAPDGGFRQRSAANNSTSGGLASTPRDDRDARSSRRGENAPASRRGGRSEQGAAASDSERGNVSEESRAVAGHRFRRAGGAWVDVNYKTSMSSTGVRRGTDAYRALVADIPELGRVAEQLGGEVIVVVRGRAYRIR